MKRDALETYLCRQSEWIVHLLGWAFVGVMAALSAGVCILVGLLVLSALHQSLVTRSHRLTKPGQQAESPPQLHPVSELLVDRLTLVAYLALEYPFFLPY